MTVLQALILGIIQGLTEFLPISSSGHLVLAQHLIHLSDEFMKNAVVFDLTLHLGTVIAVLYCYKDDLRNLWQTLIKGKSGENIAGESLNGKILLMFLASIIATGIVVLPLQHFFKGAFEKSSAASVGLIITSIILLLSLFAKGSRTISEINFSKASLIGIIQGIAAWPGISRSGSTIVAGLLLGLKGKEAARYSFLLSVPTIILASLVELKDVMETGSPEIGFGNYAVGFVAAMIFGVIAIKTMVGILEKRGLAWFSPYCLIIGIISFFVVK